mmetsp:Transcript_17558/g.25131  ORF Transcript_17558/g.25131 Transcript_17558/m.25131 type:complete len:97 (+) Transcript_17558:471-761(+)
MHSWYKGFSVCVGVLVKNESLLKKKGKRMANKYGSFFFPQTTFKNVKKVQRKKKFRLHFNHITPNNHTQTHTHTHNIHQNLYSFSLSLSLQRRNIP